jgi:hypothetical protein
MEKMVVMVLTEKMVPMEKMEIEDQQEFHR